MLHYVGHNYASIICCLFIENNLVTDSYLLLITAPCCCSFCRYLKYSLRFLTRGARFFLGLAGIFGVWLLTFPAFVNDPWEGMQYFTRVLLVYICV